MKRMHLKKRKTRKNKFINKVIVIIILMIIIIVYIFNLLNKKVFPQLISYSEIQTKKIITLIINNVVSKEVASNIDMEELFITTKDNNGDIKTIDFNSIYVNDLLTKASQSIEKNLTHLEKGDINELGISINNFNGYDKSKGVIYEIPSGVIFNNTLLNNILPKIPVRIDLIGNIFCKLKTDIKSYGINNALVEVSIEMEADIKILLPFISETTKIDTKIPIIIKIIESKVPEYYINGYLNTPSITTPIE